MKARALELFRNPWLALAFRLYLAGIFIYASSYKIVFQAEFAESIASYRLVPEVLVNGMAVVLPWAELVSGVLMLVGVRVKAAALTQAAMLLAFTLAIAWALLHGLPIGCGCFRSLEAQVTWVAVLRDLAWLGMALHVYRYDRLMQLERRLLVKVKEA